MYAKDCFNIFQDILKDKGDIKVILDQIVFKGVRRKVEFRMI